MSGAANATSPAAGAGTPRSRLPRWTRHETLVLLQARRAMEHRGRRSPQPVRLKWAAVSAYCRRHGVERGPMQCRKRWGNLSWDLKKIVAWEKNLAAAVVSGAGDNAVAAGEGEGEAPPPPGLESFWDMRGEQRRARQLPSSFDREVYDALVGGHDAAPPSDFGEDLADGDDVDADELPPPPPPLMVMPISARKYVPPTASSQQECSDPATVSAKRGGAASDKNSTSQHDGGGGGGLKDSEATYGAGRAALLAAVDKLAGAVCRIADKL
uniref:Myb-like domain-containing protein n=1 Tax=Oryza meridionalis TaxID=40149 RepID=A0A0E0CCG3_9ORYZ